MTLTPLCMSCKHLNPDWTCSAYPQSIPNEILTMDVDHNQPYKGDHGIQYEPVPDKARAAARKQK